MENLCLNTATHFLSFGKLKAEEFQLFWKLESVQIWTASSGGDLRPDSCHLVGGSDGFHDDTVI